MIFCGKYSSKDTQPQNNSSKVIINRCKIEETRKLFKQTMCCRFSCVLQPISLLFANKHLKCILVSYVSERPWCDICWWNAKRKRKFHMNVNEVVSLSFNSIHAKVFVLIVPFFVFILLFCKVKHSFIINRLSEYTRMVGTT